MIFLKTCFSNFTTCSLANELLWLTPIKRTLKPELVKLKISGEKVSTNYEVENHDFEINIFSPVILNSGWRFIFYTIIVAWFFCVYFFLLKRLAYWFFSSGVSGFWSLKLNRIKLLSSRTKVFWSSCKILSWTCESAPSNISCRLTWQRLNMKKCSKISFEKN